MLIEDEFKIKYANLSVNRNKKKVIGLVDISRLNKLGAKSNFWTFKKGPCFFIKCVSYVLVPTCKSGWWKEAHLLKRSGG